jgi:hypothetical protein
VNCTVSLARKREPELTPAPRNHGSGWESSRRGRLVRQWGGASGTNSFRLRLTHYHDAVGLPLAAVEPPLSPS